MTKREQSRLGTCTRGLWRPFVSAQEAAQVFFNHCWELNGQVRRRHASQISSSQRSKQSLEVACAVLRGMDKNVKADIIPRFGRVVVRINVVKNNSLWKCAALPANAEASSFDSHVNRLPDLSGSSIKVDSVFLTSSRMPERK